jgi:hypothetical protein
MDPFSLPSNTEFAYAHLYQPHDFLFYRSAYMIPPIDPRVAMNTNFSLAELQPRNDMMSTPETVERRGGTAPSRGRRRRK